MRGCALCQVTQGGRGRAGPWAGVLAVLAQGTRQQTERRTEFWGAAAELGLETARSPSFSARLLRKTRRQGLTREPAPAPWPGASRHPREVSHRPAISGKYQLLIKTRRWSGPCCFPSRN